MADENARGIPDGAGDPDAPSQPFGQGAPAQPPPGLPPPGQPADPYGEPVGPYGQQPSAPYGQPGDPYGQQGWQQQAGYPPPGYPSGGYAPPGYAPGYVPLQQGPQTETLAIVALIVSVAGTVTVPVIAHIAALILAATAKKNIRASGGRLTGDGLAVAAQVISWIVIVGGVLLLIAWIGFIVWVANMDPGYSTSTY